MRKRGEYGHYIPLVWDKDSDEIMRLANQGMWYRTIGKKFGLTEGQVKSHLWYRRKVYDETSRSVQPWSEDELTAARILRQKGVASTQIGQLLGRSKRSVIGALWRRSNSIGKCSTTTD